MPSPARSTLEVFSFCKFDSICDCVSCADCNCASVWRKPSTSSWEGVRPAKKLSSTRCSKGLDGVVVAGGNGPVGELLVAMVFLYVLASRLTNESVTIAEGVAGIAGVVPLAVTAGKCSMVNAVLEVRHIICT